MNEVKEIIDNIPLLLQYFLPGYWVTYLFCFFTSKKISESFRLIISCVISYMLITITNLICSYCHWLQAVTENILSISGVAIILGSICSILLAVLFCSKCFESLLVKCFSKTPHADLWRSVIDFHGGTNIKAFVKDKDYYILGHFEAIEENGNESWLSITSFTKMYIDTNKIVNNGMSYSKDKKARVIIRISDIDHIELFD